MLRARHASVRPTCAAKRTATPTRVSPRSRHPLCDHIASFASSSSPNLKQEAHTPMWEYKWDLGIRSLLPEWKLAVRPGWEGIKRDTLAGITIPTVSIPVSLAAALLSGLPPHWGLISAVIGAAAGALMGGTRHAINGPAAAMAFIVAGCVATLGFEGLLVATIGAGLLQMTTGALVKCIPLPVIWGFTTGIGTLILGRQLSPAFELPRNIYTEITSAPSVSESVSGFISLMQQMNPSAAMISFSTLALCILIPKLAPKFPITIVSVAAWTIVQYLYHLPVKVIGAIPPGLINFHVPNFPINAETIWPLASSALMLFAMGSIQAVLTAAAADKVAKKPLHDSNQELIGQGVCNTVSAAAGSMPTTGLIIQTTLNIMTGATSRRAALVHATTLAAFISVFAPLLGYIPVPSLTGVLMCGVPSALQYVATMMIRPSDALVIYRAAPVHSTTWLATFGGMVTWGLGPGILFGVAYGTALQLLTQRSVAPFRFETEYTAEDRSEMKVTLHGRLNFLGALRLKSLERQLAHTDSNVTKQLVIDARAVQQLDFTAAEQLAAVAREVSDRGVQVHIEGLAPEFAATLAPFDQSGRLRGVAPTI